MSMTFTQIVRTIDKSCGSNSSSYKIADKVLDINMALDDALAIAFEAGGKWQFDDSNHEDYPIITTNLEHLIRDYAFTGDEEGNLILDIHRVFIKHPGGIYREIFPIDAQSDYGTESFTDGQNITGIPTRYDKTANGIFLNYLPTTADYTDPDDLEDGLKIYINREGSYFTVNDTTKKPGIDPLCHEYLALKPAYKYARDKGLKNVARLEKDVDKMEKLIKSRYASRSRDEVDVLRGRNDNNHI